MYCDEVSSVKDAHHLEVETALPVGQLEFEGSVVYIDDGCYGCEKRRQ